MPSRLKMNMNNLGGDGEEEEEVGGGEGEEEGWHAKYRWGRVDRLGHVVVVGLCA